MDEKDWSWGLDWLNEIDKSGQLYNFLRMQLSIFTDEKSCFLLVVGMSKNLKFVEQVEAMFSKDDEIVVVGLN